MEFTEEQLKKIGAAMAIQAYKLEHTDILSTQEACLMLGCKKSTLYKKALPHNQYGWSKKAIIALMNR